MADQEQEHVPSRPYSTMGWALLIEMEEELIYKENYRGVVFALVARIYFSIANAWFCRTYVRTTSTSVAGAERSDTRRNYVPWYRTVPGTCRTGTRSGGRATGSTYYPSTVVAGAGNGGTASFVQYTYVTMCAVWYDRIVYVHLLKLVRYRRIRLEHATLTLPHADSIWLICLRSGIDSTQLPRAVALPGEVVPGKKLNETGRREAT